MLKKSFCFILFSLIISFLYSAINGFEKFTFINSSFTIGMLYLGLGILLYVGEKGFFNLTLYSFNKLFQNSNKNKVLFEGESDIKIEDYLNKKIEFSNTKFLLSSGICISTITFIVSFIIYNNTI
jgi:hypothetical protein